MIQMSKSDLQTEHTQDHVLALRLAVAEEQCPWSEGPWASKAGWPHIKHPWQCSPDCAELPNSTWELVAWWQMSQARAVAGTLPTARMSKHQSSASGTAQISNTGLAIEFKCFGCCFMSGRSSYSCQLSCLKPASHISTTKIYESWLFHLYTASSVLWGFLKNNSWLEGDCCF